MKRLVVLGAGESGLGAALLAKREGYAVFVSDGGTIGEARKMQLQTVGIEFEEGKHDEERILAADLIISTHGRRRRHHHAGCTHIHHAFGQFAHWRKARRRSPDHHGHLTLHASQHLAHKQPRFFGRELGGFQLGGVIQAQLFDGDLLSGKYGVYPGVAYVEAANDRWRFAAGLQPDVFSPKIPRMVDSMSGMAGSGNPGNSMKPQLRAERFINTDIGKWTFQGALADAQPSNIQPPSLASTENTGQPNYEARISFSRGTADSEASLVPYPQWEVGLSGANGSFRSFSLSNAFPAYDTNLSGIAIEGAVRIGQRLGLQGELYRGRAFAPYLGGIFQTVTTDRAAVRSQGGWAEIAWWWRPTLHTHFGYGRDRAWSKNGVQPEVRSNETTFANLFWDPSPMTTLGLEATWRRTVYEGDIYNEGLALMLSSELRF